MEHPTLHPTLHLLRGESPLDGWKFAGSGSVTIVERGVIQVADGPGVLWFALRPFEDAFVQLEWRVMTAEDNSGLLLRMPRLEDEAPAPQAIEEAIAEAIEVQIDERGLDPRTHKAGSPLHMTGALYGRAPARAAVTRPIGTWNVFEIGMSGPRVRVKLNGRTVCDHEDPSAPMRGYVGLQAHHEGASVQFRRLRVRG